MWRLTASDLSCTEMDVASDRLKSFPALELMWRLIASKLSRTDIVLDLARILCGNPRINPKHRQPVG